MLRSTGRVTDVLLCGGLALLISIAVSAVRRPVPMLHDEFSYLLAADTFASGRLSNEPHPFWMHFESMHILQQPRYASKYPPMQGLFLAAGQVIAHSPLAGVWLSTSLAAAIICWMLQGWTRRRWALLGGLIAAFHAGLQLEWGQTFMGSAPAVIGSSLLYGAWPRWCQHRSAINGIAGAFGLVVLANSRPFEGLLISLPVVVLLFGQLVTQRDSASRGRCRDLRSLLPAGAVLGLSCAAMLFYNHNVTGKLFRLPYSLHSSQYMSGRLFVWQPPLSSPPQYRHAIMKEFHAGWEADAYNAQRSWGAFLRVKWQYFLNAIFVLLSPLTLLAVLTGIYGWWHSRQAQLTIVITSLVLMFAGASSAVWVFPHYLAPGLPPLLILATLGARQFRMHTSQTGISGNRLFPGLCVVCVATFVTHSTLYGMTAIHGWSADRERIEASLDQQPKKDLIIVQYDRQHSPHDEWVYNRADIDDAAIVWARDLGPEQNARLKNYFRDRAIWLLRADHVPRTLLHADESESSLGH